MQDTVGLSDERLLDLIGVRPLRGDEWAAWRSLRLRALEDAPYAFSTTFQWASERPDQWWRERTASLAGSSRRVMFVAELGAALAACAGVDRDYDSDDVPTVISMWVAPEARRRGLARALLDAAVEFCRAAGGPVLRLFVIEGNDAARRLYLRYGFVETGRIERDHARAEREMELRLG